MLVVLVRRPTKKTAEGQLIYWRISGWADIDGLACGEDAKINRNSRQIDTSIDWYIIYIFPYPPFLKSRKLLPSWENITMVRANKEVNMSDGGSSISMVVGIAATSSCRKEMLFEYNEWVACETWVIKMAHSLRWILLLNLVSKCTTTRANHVCLLAIVLYLYR